MPHIVEKKSPTISPTSNQPKTRPNRWFVFRHPSHWIRQLLSITDSEPTTRGRSLGITTVPGQARSCGTTVAGRGKINSLKIYLFVNTLWYTNIAGSLAGISPFLVGDNYIITSSKGPFTIAMLVQRSVISRGFMH